MATATTASAAATSTADRVAPQGGILEGVNPSQYSSSNPITLFIIQVGLIIIICHLLHWPLSKIRQPRVIAEVIGGIILGPSVMGHIPGFTNAIFPTASIPNLTLVANLGLILYLFMIGLETDVRFLLSNWRIATSVTVAGLALPFGVGCGLAWGIYNAFRNDPGIKPIDFSIYMLFVGIATAITAFPVLCRILTALKLLDTSVGVITLSAGVANDVVGWILLALCVALVNAGSGLTALWILLICFSYILMLFFAVKPALLWVLRKTNNMKNGPSQGAIALILLMALTSAFFTGIIGIHPIFGGFVVGLIIPREDRFNIYVIEKLEDLVGALFLPLYFTLSGLSTNLGLLNTGTAWGYVFATTFVALFTKIIGASVAARLHGLVWRESLTIGALMSCKGLVELIVLNIGLQAKILSTRTFTIFVVMALLTTFMTTPMVTVLYPPWYQKKIEAWKRGEIDWDTGAPIARSESSTDEGVKSPERVNRLLVYLRLDNMPALLSLLSLFGTLHPLETQALTSEGDSQSGPQPNQQPKRVVRAHGIRLVELTDRDSSVMTVAQMDEYSRHDPVVNTFRTVGQLHNIAASGEVAIMPEDRFAEALITRSSNISSDLLIVPWSETGSIGDSQILSSANVDDKLASTYLTFVKSVLESNEHNIGVFFSRSSDDTSEKARSQERPKLLRAYSHDVSRRDFPTTPLSTQPHHIFLAYFGGSDDKLALGLVLQLCESAKVTATIVRVSDSAGSSSSDDFFDAALARLSADITSRVKTDTTPGPITIEEILQYADPVSDEDTSDARKPSLVVAGRRGGADLDVGKSTPRLNEEVRGCFGVVAGQLVASRATADLLVVQAKSEAVAT